MPNKLKVQPKEKLVTNISGNSEFRSVVGSTPMLPGKKYYFEIQI